MVALSKSSTELTRLAGNGCSPFAWVRRANTEYQGGHARCQPRSLSFIRQNVTGLIAIFIALGGTAYANNEWTGANIVDGSLTSFDYKNDNIRSLDVLDATLRAADLAPNAIPSDDECGAFFVCFSSTKDRRPCGRRQ